MINGNTQLIAHIGKTAACMGGMTKASRGAASLPMVGRDPFGQADQASGYAQQDKFISQVHGL